LYKLACIRIFYYIPSFTHNIDIIIMYSEHAFVFCFLHTCILDTCMDTRTLKKNTFSSNTTIINGVMKKMSKTILWAWDYLYKFMQPAIANWFYFPKTTRNRYKIIITHKCVYLLFITRYALVQFLRENCNVII